MTDNSPGISRRPITLEARDVEALRETIDRLCLEVEKLRASRKRLVQAADTERRTIERDLHGGVQQHLVGLAVNLQLASQLVDTDLAAAKALLEEMERDLQQALAATAQLAQQIYPPLLEAGSLASALRAAATSTGIRASVKVEAASGCPAEVVRTVYLCCLGALEHAGADAPAAITVREADGALAFDVVAAGAGSDAEFDRLCDRVEALGGRLTVRTEPRGITRMSGSLPLSQ